MLHPYNILLEPNVPCPQPKTYAVEAFSVGANTTWR